MDWTEQVERRMKRNNQILFSPEDQCLQELAGRIGGQNRRALVLWAFDLAEGTVRELEERYPEDSRPQIALEISRLWAEGKAKMPQARPAILQCHAMAKELNLQEYAALCHAVGQACSVVHTGGHAMGFPIYELTALVRRHGLENCWEPVENRIFHYQERLSHWTKREKCGRWEWAGFLAKA